MRVPLLLLSFIVLAGVVGRSSPARAAWPHDSWSNLPVCTAAGAQNSAVAVSDGTGMIVAWLDGRGGGIDIYAQRVSASGTPYWHAGAPISVVPASPTSLAIASDGAGGCYIVWAEDRGGGTASDIYAQHVSASGTIVWATNGVVVCNAAGAQTTPVIVTDGYAPVIGWCDARTDVGDLYAQRLNPSTGAAYWAANGVAVCTLSGAQLEPAITTDGAGGAILAWVNNPSGTTYRARAQRLSSTGVAQWAANGVLLSSLTAQQRNPAIASDLAGGAIVACETRSADFDIAAQRVNASGVLQWGDGAAICVEAGHQFRPWVQARSASAYLFAWEDHRAGRAQVYAQSTNSSGTRLWGLGGLSLSASAGEQLDYSIVYSGSGGGLFACWNDVLGTVSDAFAQKVSTGGALLWGPNGVPVGTARGAQADPVITAGGAGTIVAWSDERNGAADIYAQLVDETGYLGTPAPALLAVRDVPGDEGGRVRLAWTASYLDADPDYTIGSYLVMRYPPGASKWDTVGTVPAAPFQSYSFVSPTTVDSTAGGNPLTSFMVLARTQDLALAWYSASLGGYSVDNLPPPPPGAARAVRTDARATLTWTAAGAADLAGYRIERSPTAAFAPGHTSLVARTSGLRTEDPSPAAWYRIVALDTHGNESVPAVAALEGVEGVTLVEPGARLALDPPAPNPAREAMELRFLLPRAAPAVLSVFDPSGRRVRGWALGDLDAGPHVVRWDGRDDAGRVLPSALYFVRLEVEGRALVRRALWLH